MDFVIYHNPRCSKSRKTLSILESNKNVNVQVKLYLKNPPNEEEICGLLKKLGMSARDLIRHSQEEFQSSGLTLDSRDDLLVKAMVDHPKIIERPIVVCGDKAILGRPPESVLGLM